MVSYLPGELVLVDLTPVIGHEQGPNPSNPLRPCLVISDTEALTAAGDYEVYTIVPLTTSRRVKGAFAPPVVVSHPRHGAVHSRALVGHLRSVDPLRIKRKLDKVSDEDYRGVLGGNRTLLSM